MFLNEQHTAIQAIYITPATSRGNNKKERQKETAEENSDYKAAALTLTS